MANRTFFDCTVWTGVAIPDSVTKIEKDVFAYCPSLTIYGEEGSDLQQYAKENMVPFPIGIPADLVSLTVLGGDMDANDNINSSDARQILHKSVNKINRFINEL